MWQLATGNRRWAVGVVVLVAAAAAHAASAEAPKANGPAPTPLAIEQALDDLKSADWILRWAAMTQLARWRVKEAVPPIKGILSGRDHPWVRGRALVALAEFLGEEVLGEATAFSGDGAAELRAAATEALGIIGSPRGEPAIAARLKDPAVEVRCQAIVALARVQGIQAWETVAPSLEDADPAIVRHATRALLHIGSPESRRKMIELLDHKDAMVRHEAANTLGKVRVPEAIAALLRHMATDGDVKVRTACEKALAAFDGRTLALPLLGALRGARREYYQAALRILAVRPTPEATAGTAALVREPDERYRDVYPDAFHLLTQLAPDRYRDIFIHYLGSEHPPTRQRAIECLALCKGADHFKLLQPLLTDRDQGTRAAAFRVVRQATEGAPPGGIVDYLAEALLHTDAWTRRTALDLMGERIPPGDVPKAVELLAPLLGGAKSQDREVVAKALARIGNEAARRQVAQAQGYLTDWMLIGPFPRENRNKGFGAAFFPEHEIDFQKTYDPYVIDSSAAFGPTEATCGGTKKKGLALRPATRSSHHGRLVASFRLELPKADDLKLTLFVGLQDGSSETDGVRFEVHVDGAKRFELKVLKPEGWQPVEVSLAAEGGKATTVDLVADPLEDAKGDNAVVGEPRVVAGGKTVADLLTLAETAPVRIEGPEAKTKLAWQRWQVSRIDGQVPLYDIIQPPIYDKVAYGVADVASAEERVVRLWVKSDDGFILWRNGVKIGERTSTGEETLDVALRKGHNRFLIKSFNHRDWWFYHVRLMDKEGAAVNLFAEGK